MSGDWLVFLNHSFAILFRQLVTSVGIERIVKRLNLLPQALHLRSESIRVHIILFAPHCSGVFETHFFSALVTKFDKARVIFPIWRRYLMPAKPDSLQFLRIPAFSKNFLHI